MEMLTEDETGNLTAASEPRFPSGEVTIDSYHSYDQLQSLAAELVTAFPNLVTKYSIGSSVQERVPQLLDNTEIHLVPSMNPDGFEAVTRGNYNQVDLNRGFPGAELLGATRAELLEDR